jgi:23S rRNA pseudouridine1911/1915/1917 synthase
VAGTEPVEIPNTLAGMRVDRVVSLLTGIARSQARTLVEEGGVWLGGKQVTDPSRHVSAADVLRVDESLLISAVAQRGSPPEPSADVNFGVLYEDERIIVVDKPAGLVVHPGAGHRDDTLVSGLLARFPDIAGMAGDAEGADPERPGIVHRLDRDTSGLLVVARDGESHASLAAQLSSRTMGREYVALVAGHVAADSGVVDASLQRSARVRTRMAIAARGQGRSARTHYSATKRYGEPIPTTQLLVRLETGRTHQIRVHLSAIGHPVIGDATYRGRRAELPLARPFLHAWRLHLRHPADGREMEFTSPLPADLEEVLSGLR